jgi:AcrR family transcriptional regulator
MGPSSHPYHHGDLKAALLQAAIETIGASGPASMSLREVARRAGVTHSAAIYHYGDKAGLLTAVAVDGFGLLTRQLSSTYRARQDFLEVGVAYVRFAVEHRPHFEVMYRPDLYHAGDPELLEAKSAAARLLYGREHPDQRQLLAGVAAWSIVHGLATLWLNGNLPPQLGDDPEAITRLVASRLSPSGDGAVN